VVLNGFHSMFQARSWELQRLGLISDSQCLVSVSSQTRNVSSRSHLRLAMSRLGLASGKMSNISVSSQRSASRLSSLSQLKGLVHIPAADI